MTSFDDIGMEEYSVQDRRDEAPSKGSFAGRRSIRSHLCNRLPRKANSGMFCCSSEVISRRCRTERCYHDRFHEWQCETSSIQDQPADQPVFKRSFKLKMIIIPRSISGLREQSTHNAIVASGGSGGVGVAPLESP